MYRRNLRAQNRRVEDLVGILLANQLFAQENAANQNEPLPPVHEQENEPIVHEAHDEDNQNVLAQQAPVEIPAVFAAGVNNEERYYINKN